MVLTTGQKVWRTGVRQGEGVEKRREKGEKDQMRQTRSISQYLSVISLSSVFPSQPFFIFSLASSDKLDIRKSPWKSLVPPYPSNKRRQRQVYQSEPIFLALGLHMPQ